MGKGTNFLYLNEEDMIKAGVLDIARCIDVEEELFDILSKGDYVMGGLPVWDVGRSYEVYQNAVKMGLGQTLKLWDEPYLN
jgi:ornithine cyclodeaminase/alanine dehydrogenase-like protein (mu-crystallin family)